MVRKLALGLSLALTASLVVTPVAMAQDKVTGAFDLDWNACWEGPTDEVPDWIGTIDLDGDAYDMLFFNLGDGRPPNQELAAPLGPFIEIWAVYDGLDISFDEDCAMEAFEGDLVMWGHDAGVSDSDAQEYEMAGTVVEAFGDHADLAGSDVVMSGSFTLTPDGAPLTAPGVLEDRLTSSMAAPSRRPSATTLRALSGGSSRHIPRLDGPLGTGVGRPVMSTMGLHTLGCTVSTAPLIIRR